MYSYCDLRILTTIYFSFLLSHACVFSRCPESARRRVFVNAGLHTQQNKKETSITQADRKQQRRTAHLLWIVDFVALVKTETVPETSTPRTPTFWCADKKHTIRTIIQTRDETEKQRAMHHEVISKSWVVQPAATRRTTPST